MALGNDTRGWIMTCISGIACVLGASIICADIIVRHFPGMKNFRIQDSDAFLSSSLSLSFGVMLFSALYTMLPSAKRSLQEGGFSPKAAAWTLIACFLGGVIGIQIISKVLHHFIPSYVVECEHSHDEENQESSSPPMEDLSKHHCDNEHPERTPQAQRPRPTHRATDHPDQFDHIYDHQDPSQELTESETFQTALSRKPTLQSRLSSTIHKMTAAPKDTCDGDGPCYGFSEPCGQECFKIVQARSNPKNRSIRRPRKSLGGRSQSVPHTQQPTESTPLLGNLGGINEERHAESKRSGRRFESDAEPLEEAIDSEEDDEGPTPGGNDSASPDLHKTTSTVSHEQAHDEHHHHHVPTNAFLSIGLQTSIAIALHKLPEGFITYATNHANPKLGFSVFLALFIHNITEGFAMALPLYLAINSRWKAMFWSSLLGGFSQPLGAGVAALWFKIAGSGDYAPSEGVYGCMFAITSGIMASVALQLFSESLDLTHNRNLCMVFAFVGMGILGASSALTA
ncbi:hypothetical protein MBLNU457_6598t1 [Dothideomycetes sp. NU457]